eukprot:1232146-Rhodomonas_salina.2
MPCPVLTQYLPTPYAIPGTVIAHRSVSRHAPYAMSGTDIVYCSISLRAPYSMPGTDVGLCCYQVSRIEFPSDLVPQLQVTTALCAPYAFFGTDLVYLLPAPW